MKVLVADDNRATRFAMRSNLGAWGYEVVEVGDGLAAWDAVNADDPPRIAILDWMMPGLEGVEVCRRLAERPEGPFIYTILLTAKKDPQDLAYALEYGAYNFLTKPISAIELRSFVNVARRLVEADDQVKDYAFRMERLAVTDPLTGVFNRRHFLEAAEKEISRFKRHARPLSMLMLDLDHFKRVNDEHGHAAGDEVLKTFSKTCVDALRNVDVFARVGGEEFAALLSETGGPAALEAAERLRARVEAASVSGFGQDLRFTVSIGAASCRGGDDTLDHLLRRADDALYQAKAEGRNRAVLYEEPGSSE